MDEQTAKEAEQVSVLCRYGRYACVVLGALSAILFAAGAVAMTGGGPRGQEFIVDVGPIWIRDDLSPPGTRAWGVLVLAAGILVICLGLRALYRLLSNLQQGAIFTHGNVLLLRQLSLASMAGSVLHHFVPVFSRLLLSAHMIEPLSSPAQGSVTLSVHDMPGSFFMGLLLLLAGWIMDVGRRTHDEAERMRSDAELVI